MIDYKNTIKHLKSCVFTCINPELANEAVTTIQSLVEQLEQILKLIESNIDDYNRNFPFTHDDEVKIEALQSLRDEIKCFIKDDK